MPYKQRIAPYNEEGFHAGASTELHRHYSETAKSSAGFKKQVYKSKPAKPKPNIAAKRKKLLSDILFFAVLLGVVVGVGIYKQNHKQSKGLFGFSFYTVVSGSMQREIPKGSLVVVRWVPGTELSAGDDITFYRDADTVVTHRIVEVLEEYEGSGGRAFITQGIENPLPDETPVHEMNVVGKVVRVFPKAGLVGSLVRANLKWVVILLALVTALTASLRNLASCRKRE